MIDKPTLADVEALIARLDAEHHTLVMLETSGEAHMAIGGGCGRYVVYATFDNDVFYNLLSSGDPAKTVMVKAGGQEGDYPESTIVDTPTAVRAARSFVERGELDSELDWGT